MNSILTITDKINESVGNYPSKLALSIVGGKQFTYNDLKQNILKLSEKLYRLGIKKGDKVAILSENSPFWGISYLSILNCGATVVPILNDFSKNEIDNIINHSEAKIIFVSKSLKTKIIDIQSSQLKYIIDIETGLIENTSSEIIEINETNKIVEDSIVEPDDIAAIIYTSGTTGSSKGVMLSHKNIVSNIYSTFGIQKIIPSDRLLSILPLSHTYECTLGFLMPLFYGASVYYIQGPPIPSILLPALKTVKPTMMLTVPLIIEKIYKNKVLPSLQSGIKKHLYRFCFTRKLLNIIAGKKLYKTFGGKLHFFGIGGALLDEQTEKFLREAKFPYAIGYGLTETSPLLAGSNPKLSRFRSTGFCIPGQELKLIDINDETRHGEIVAKGNNIMKGYYKNEELTKKSFTSDGWFRTGDLGFIDNDNYLFIKGRIKNLILGANGENIYPEEIESIINKHKLVVESIVYEIKGKIVARVHLDYAEIEKRYNSFIESSKVLQNDINDYIKKTLDEIKTFVNTQVNSFSKLAIVIEQPVPFEKTPTQKIKKFLYTKI